MQAIFWMGLSALVIYKTNFFRQVWENPHVLPFFFEIAEIGVLLNICLMFYMTIYLPYVAGITEEYETYCPKIVPTLTFSGLVVFFSFMISVWPIWGILTPIYLIIMFMGYSMSLIFLPSGFLGVLLFWVFFIASFYVAHTLPHDPVW